MLLAGCGNGDRLPQLELSGHTMGTTFNIVLVAPPATVSKEQLQEQVISMLDHVDALASTWRSDSELAAFNATQSDDWITVSPEFCAVVAAALAVSEVSGGAFDITVAPLVNLWGFGPDGIVDVPPPDDAITATLQAVGYEKLQTRCAQPALRKARPDLEVDLSGWAKGYAVDRVAAVLSVAGLDDYLVEVGGELRASGHNARGQKWAIAIEAPLTSRRVPQAVIHVTDTGVATSGDYRNYFEHDGHRYSHTIDSRTGKPVAHNLAAVTVLNPSTAYADAMATALLVLGPEAGPALARKIDIAGYFLVREPSGIREITTPGFDLLGAK